MRRRSAGPASRTDELQQGPVARAAHGDWLTLGRDGRLSLYAVTDGGLLRWTETAVGGPSWSGPHFVAVDALTHLTVAQGANRYVHFFARRDRKGAAGQRVVDIAHAIQYQTGLAFTDWFGIGNPHYKHWEQGWEIGPPAAAVARDGTVHVFVRNAQGGLSLRRENPDGKWKLWENLGGVGLDVRARPVALDSGRLEVCSAAESGLFVWRQSAPGKDFEQPSGFALNLVPGTAAALETGPDRVTYLWADAGLGGTAAWRQGGWPMPLGGGPTHGGYAVLRAPVDGYDCTVVACRGDDGSVLLGMGGTESEQAGFWWQSLDEPCQGAPALARDGHGRIVMVLIDPRGFPKVARQESGSGLALSTWSGI